jgi:hypothetical protein
VKKETTKPREEVFIYKFCGRAGQLDEFCFRRKKSRRGTLTTLETHIVMSSLIFRLALTLVLHLTLLFMICLVSLMDLTIAHMVLVYERTSLCLDALVMTHVLIVVIVSRVCLVFLMDGLTLTLSPDT